MKINFKNTSFETRLFLVAGVFGIFLRIFALNWHDFWYDEAFSYHLAKLPTKDLLSAVLTDNNPPLYYLLIHFLLTFSRNEIFLRVPSLLFNLATILLLYEFLQKKLNVKVASYAASLFALSPLEIYIATEARLHSLATFLTLTLIVSFSKFSRSQNFKNLLSFILVAVLAFYTQYYLLLLYLPMTLLVLTKKTKLRLKTWLKVASIPLFAFLPWIYASFGLIHNSCSCPNTLLSLPASLVSPVLAGVGEVTLRSFPQLSLTIFSFFALAATITLLFFFKGILIDKAISALYLIPLAVLSLAGFFWPVFSPKAFAIFSPLFFAIVAIGISKFKRSANRFFVPLSFFLLLISFLQITDPFFSGQKIKPIYEIVKTDTNAAIFHTSVDTFYSLNFYTKNLQKNSLITENPLSSTTTDFIGGKKEEIKDINSFWLIDSPKWIQEDERERLVQRLYENFLVVEKYQIDNTLVQYLIRK